MGTRTRPDRRCACRHDLSGLLIMSVLLLQCACAAESPVPERQRDRDTGADHAKTLALTAVTVPVTLTLEVDTPMPTGHPKLASSLSQLARVYQQEGIESAQAFARAHMMVLEGDRVEVEMITATGAIEELAEEVQAEGGRIQGHRGTLVQALLPMAALEGLAQRQDVQVIREVRRAGH